MEENTNNGHWKITFRLQLKITGGIQDKIIVKLLVQNKIKDYYRKISWKLSKDYYQWRLLLENISEDY